MKTHSSKKKPLQKRKVSPLNIFMIVAIAILLVLLFYLVVLPNYHPTPVNRPEQTIADFSLVSSSPMTQNGKVVVLFIGAEACPYCAAESWSIVSALAQFGAWNGLSRVVSNSTDSIPDVPGYSFANSSLISSQVVFEEVETTTTSWDQRLQSMNSTEISVFNEYDQQGSIPFLLVGGMYLHVGAAVSPQQISNMNWDKAYNLSESQGNFHNQIESELGNISRVINYMIGLPSVEAAFMLSVYLDTTGVLFTSASK